VTVKTFQYLAVCLVDLLYCDILIQLLLTIVCIYKFIYLLKMPSVL